jgi:hypothetical protein
MRKHTKPRNSQERNHKNSHVVKWKRTTYSDGSSSERTYNEQGQEETYKDSNGYYAIKGKRLTKEEFDSFVNDEIIELNGIKYKRI